MEFKDVVTQLFERSNAMQVYWGYYLTIVFALLAFFGSVNPSPQLRRLAIIIGVVFLGVAAANLIALVEVGRQRWVLREILDHDDLLRPPLPAAALADMIKKSVNPPTIRSVVGLHLVGDVVTLVAIWTLSVRRGRS